MSYSKHVGIYSNIEEYNKNKGELISPYVAYVGTSDNFQIFYSDDVNLGANPHNIANELNQKLMALENKTITLTEKEYEELISLPEGSYMWVTPLGEEKKEIKYDASVFYYTYNPEDLPKIE